MTREDLHALETLVDRCTLNGVVSALSEICSRKEEHVAGNWQDEGLAKKWRRAELQCDRLAQNLPCGL
jgi:hypothetical protein